MLKFQEHYDLMTQFEREHRGRMDKEPKESWPRGIIYQDGHVNELFLTYRRGYAYGKAIAPAQDAERERQQYPYRIFQDGDAWCCIGPNFVDLQKSDAGFGPTPRDALEALELIDGNKKRAKMRANNWGMPDAARAQRADKGDA